jgi:rhodanese-related sulfurtransferase
MTTSPPSSLVLEYPPPEPGEHRQSLLRSLSQYTDAWDLSQDLQRGCPGLAVIDARSPSAFASGHIQGAISFPHRTMSEENVQALDRRTVYVVYCDGIGCNASTKGAYRLSCLGFKVKELIGGLDWWRRDGYAVVSTINSKV